MSSLDELRKENARLNAILDGGVRERLLAISKRLLVGRFRRRRDGLVF